MESISETITIMTEAGGGFSYWVKKIGTNKHITGKVYADKSKCIEDAKLKDAEINKSGQ